MNNSSSILHGSQYQEPIPPEYFAKTGSAPRGDKQSDGTMFWHHKKQEERLRPLHKDDLIFNLPGARSLNNWWTIIKYFNLDNTKNERYQPKDRETHCNGTLSDLTRAFGVMIPFWLISEKDNELRELTANGIANHLPKLKSYWPYEQTPWVKVPDQKNALKLANQGIPIVVAVRNKMGHGHVGLVAPSEDGKLHIAQAGEHRGIVPYNEEKFTEDKYDEPVFFVNSADKTSI